MSQSVRRILATVTALAVLTVAVNCACAGAVFALRPAVRSCCAAKHVPASSRHSNPAAPCPHCQGAAMQAEAGGKGMAGIEAFVAMAPAVPVVPITFLRPVELRTPSAPGRTIGCSPPTLLALGCASLT